MWGSKGLISGPHIHSKRVNLANIVLCVWGNKELIYATRIERELIISPSGKGVNIGKLNRIYKSGRRVNSQCCIHGGCIYLANTDLIASYSVMCTFATFLV